MATTEVTTRLRLQTIARTVTGLTSARVVLGLDDPAQTYDFFANLGAGVLTTKALTGNVATLTTNQPHGLPVGAVVTVKCNPADPIFDGTVTLTAVTATTVSYAVVHADVGSTATTGTLAAVPYFIIHGAEQTGFSLFTQLQDFDVTAQLFFGFTKDTAYDYTDIESLVFGTLGLREKYKVGTNYTDCPVPKTLKIAKPRIRSDINPIVGVYDMTFNFYGA